MTPVEQSSALVEIRDNLAREMARLEALTAEWVEPESASDVIVLAETRHLINVELVELCARTIRRMDPHMVPILRGRGPIPVGDMRQVRVWQDRIYTEHRPVVAEWGEDCRSRLEIDSDATDFEINQGVRR